MKKKKEQIPQKLWDNNYERCNIYTMEIPGEDRKGTEKYISENFVNVKHQTKIQKSQGTESKIKKPKKSTPKHTTSKLQKTKTKEKILKETKG